MSDLQGKVQFDKVYFEKSPHAYLRAMSQVKYYLPDQTKPYYERIIATLVSQKSPLRILDVGSSYGVNAALLKHSLDMQTLYDFFLVEREPMSTCELQQFFAEHLDRPELVFYGLDISKPAVQWAEKIGLCEKGIACDLDSCGNQELQERLCDIDLIISTGCIGYLGAKGIHNLFSQILGDRRHPIFAFSALRMVDLAPIEDTLSQFQYRVTQLNEQPFLQRQFADSFEKESILQNLRSKGIETSQLEEKGGLYANFFVASPG